jgi:hypothetical protein
MLAKSDTSFPAVMENQMRLTLLKEPAIVTASRTGVLPVLDWRVNTLFVRQIQSRRLKG